jgi:hypothetical protein
VDTNGSAVTISFLGTTSAGRSSTATALASCFDRPKNFGRTSALFPGVITLASSRTTVMQSFPDRSGSTTSGNLWTSCAATFR